MAKRKDLPRQGALPGAGRLKGKGMKKYKCHKIVEAGKITGFATESIENNPDLKFTIEHFVELDDNSRRIVSIDWLNKHKPEVGGYFVRYEDGYESYSPAEAFEKGYKEIVDDFGNSKSLSPNQ
jgi:hypothetical protein